MKPLSIKINNFEGPFDLLLHLIKKNEMDIYDIKIYEITNQYLQYLEGMKEMDLEVTSEFIVIAATLIEIKSKFLLPKPKMEEVAAEDDPRKILVDKLIEYKNFKAAAEFLKSKEGETGVTYGKKPEIIEAKVERELDFKGITILDLYTMFDEMMRLYSEKINVENVISREIPFDLFKIEDKMVEIEQRIALLGRVDFSELIKACNSKIERVVTFLALLELMKIREVKATQENSFEEIYIERTNESERNEYKSVRN